VGSARPASGDAVNAVLDPVGVAIDEDPVPELDVDELPGQGGLAERSHSTDVTTRDVMPPPRISPSGRA
jgi:hypothetical protein